MDNYIRKNTNNINITTSIPREIYDLAREKALKWNHCLIYGIKKMANSYIPNEQGVSYEETELNKKMKQVSVMQSTIDELNDQLEALKKD